MMDQKPKNPLQSSLDVGAQPLETFIKTVTTGGTSSLDEPRPLSEPMQPKLIGNLCSVHSIGEILLVGKDKEEGIPELILVQHPLQLLASLRNTFPIVRVDDKDDALSVLEIVSPERADLVLPSDIPHSEGDVLVLDRLDIEADGRDCGNDFAKLELVQDGRLTSSVESNHQNTHLPLAQEASKSFRKQETHGRNGTLAWNKRKGGRGAVEDGELV